MNDWSIHLLSKCILRYSLIILMHFDNIVQFTKGVTASQHGAAPLMYRKDTDFDVGRDRLTC